MTETGDPVKRAIGWAAAASLCATMTGCLAPEKFTASLNVAPDGSSEYRYEGTAVHILAAAAIQKQGSLSAKDEAGLQADAAKSAKAPGVKDMRYLGSGRYQLVIDESLRKGQQATALKLFTMTQAKDGTYTISGPIMKAQDVAQLQTLAIKVDGKAEVTLPPNAKVLSQNATSTPGVFSKTYVWKIGSPADKPQITFTLAG